MRNKCLRKFFPDQDDYKTIKKEFVDFALMSNDFLMQIQLKIEMTLNQSNGGALMEEAQS
jgi:hypothetical protein